MGSWPTTFVLRMSPILFDCIDLVSPEDQNPSYSTQVRLAHTEGWYITNTYQGKVVIMATITRATREAIRHLQMNDRGKETKAHCANPNRPSCVVWKTETDPSHGWNDVNKVSQSRTREFRGNQVCHTVTDRALHYAMRQCRRTTAE